MISNSEFVKQSLELHLFFGRIMKEHAFFLELGFTPSDSNYKEQADLFKVEFESLLEEVIFLSNGVVSHDVLHSGEVITQFTLVAEMKTSFYTGTPISVELTKMESDLDGNNGKLIVNPMLEQNVFMINQRAAQLISTLIQFKSMILSKVLSCNMFTMNVPSLIEHIIHEAKLYQRLLQQLQNRESLDYILREELEQEEFWNHIMGDHAKFIRGSLDPSEEELFAKADMYGKEFEKLEKEAKSALQMRYPFDEITQDSLKATREIRDFKAQGTQGLLECEIKAVILPLLADHTLREANHYIRLLKNYSD